LRILKSPQVIAEALKNRDITERDKFYFVLMSIFINSVFESHNLLNIFGSPYLIHWQIQNDTVLWIIQKCLILGGLFWAFQANSNGDNRQFLDRFICLQATLLLRVTILVFVLYFILIAISSRHLDFSQTYIFTIILTGKIFPLCATAYVYIKLRLLIFYVASTNST
jgi:hypothetical protein